MVDLAALGADLLDEQRAVVSRVVGLSLERWLHATPAEGWSVGDAVSHLCFFSEMALLAIVDPDRFLAERTIVADESPRPDLALTASGPGICDHWMSVTLELVEAAHGPSAPRRVPWYGPDMSPASFLTARVMETWAHGQDIADGLGLPPVLSSRLRHVCQLGVMTRGYAYDINGLPEPPVRVAVRLSGPDGETWTWNDSGAEASVTGSALDFALVVTQRRDVDETDLLVEGADARTWMEIAQVFAGPPRLRD